MMINNYHNKNILLVDDDESILTLIETILHKDGYSNILKACSGQDAVFLAKEKQPSLIILDIMLPDFDGFEICKKIREKSMAPIIFLSAKSEESDKVNKKKVKSKKQLRTQSTKAPPGMLKKNKEKKKSGLFLCCIPRSSD